jgi:hypothetical protein
LGHFFLHIWGFFPDFFQFSSSGPVCTYDQDHHQYYSFIPLCFFRLLSSYQHVHGHYNSSMSVLRIYPELVMSSVLMLAMNITIERVYGITFG